MILDIVKVQSAGQKTDSVWTGNTGTDHNFSVQRIVDCHVLKIKRSQPSAAPQRRNQVRLAALVFFHSAVIPLEKNRSKNSDPAFERFAILKL